MKKTRRWAFIVARSTSGGLRIAQDCWTEQRESPRQIWILNTLTIYSYGYNNPLHWKTYPVSRHKGCADRHIPRTSIVAMFWQYLESCEVSWRQNKVPIERLIIMSWDPAQYPLQHFDVLPSHVSAWRGLQSNLYRWVIHWGDTPSI